MKFGCSMNFVRLVIFFSNMYCRCSFLKISLFLYGINLSLVYYNRWIDLTILNSFFQIHISLLKLFDKRFILDI